MWMKKMYEEYRWEVARSRPAPPHTLAKVLRQGLNFSMPQSTQLWMETWLDEMVISMFDLIWFESHFIPYLTTRHRMFTKVSGILHS